MATRCPGCMKLKEKSPVCEHCGYNENVPNYSHQLPVGTKLHGQYTVGKVLGQGGFGITYIGWDDNLDIPLAIKEYYPSGIVSRDNSYSLEVTSTGYNTEIFQNNRERFMREARAMAKLTGIPGIVKIYNYFPENNTAYITMEYVQGTDLKRYIKLQGRPLTPKETFAILRPVMDALSKVHEAGLVHRDISPDNIMIQRDGQAKLLDFGAVREVKDADVAKNLSRSTESILKHGYAPIEQYQRRGNLGPWTDIYALCATVYYCLTQDVPPDAPERMIELAEVAWEKIDGLTEKQMEVFRHGMALLPRDRIISIDQLRQELFPPEPERIPEPEVEPAIPEPPVEETPKHPEPMREQREAVPTVMMLTPQKPEELPAVASPEPKKPSRQELLKQKQERLEAERREKEKQQQRREQARLEAERLERERQERWKQEQLRQEQEKKAQLRQEKERRDREKQEKLCLEQEKKEQERLEAQRQKREQLRLEKEQRARLEAQRLEKERLEKERRESAKQEKRRLEQERREAEQRRRREEQQRQEEEKQQRHQAQLERRRVRQEQQKAAITEETTTKRPAPSHKPFAILAGLMLVAAIALGAFLVSRGTEKTMQDVSVQTPGETVEVVEETQTAATEEVLVEPTISVLDVVPAYSPAENPTYSAGAWKNNVMIDQPWTYCKGLKTAEIQSIVFLDAIAEAPAESWDISKNQDGSVLAWAHQNGSVKELYFAANGGINANAGYHNAECLPSIAFSAFPNVEIIRFNGFFHTDQLTSLSGMFDGCGKLKSLDIGDWKTSSVRWTRGMFSDCISLEELDLHNWNTSSLRETKNMFNNCKNLKSLEISGWKPLGLWYTDCMFQNCSSLVELDLSGWNTSACKTMKSMFAGCSSLKKLDISKFNTASVETMAHMFNGCSSLTQLDLSGFRTGNVVSMSYMFNGCSSLTQLDISNFRTDNVRTMSSMFRGCSSLTELDLSHFNTQRVNYLENMFQDCKRLMTLNLSKWVVSNAYNMSCMFKGCTELEDLKLNNWNVSNVSNYTDFMEPGKTINGRPWEEFFNPELRTAENTTAKNPTYSPDAWKNNMLMRNALDACKGLRKEEIQSVIVLDTIADAPAEHWDISQKQDGSVLAWTHQNGDVKELYLAADGGINAYWGSNYGQKDPGVSFQGFYNVEVILFNGFFHIDQLSDLTKMFSGCSKLKDLDIEYWNTSNIVNMYATFAGCASLKELDLSNWKTTNLFSTGEMFSRCKNLTKLDFSGWSTAGVRHMESMFQNCSSLVELDLSGWNTSRVKNMENMFSGCSSLTKLDISKFTTENVESMAGMFARCSSLTELDISGFRTGNVYSMASMFSGCSSLAKLDISSFRTGGVRNMASMFEGCSSLTALDLSHFNTYRVNYMENMFRDCENLMTLNLSKWVVSSAYNMSYMFAGCKSLTELDLSGWKPFRGCLHTDFMEPGKTINGRPWEEFFQ